MQKGWFTGLWFLLLCLPAGIRAQDPAFTQLATQVLQINPGFAGMFSGKMRVAMNMRQRAEGSNGQFMDRLAGVAIDTRFPAGKRDYWSFQGLLATSRQGQPIYDRQLVRVGGGLIKLLKMGRYGMESQYVSVAFQAGLDQFAFRGGQWFSNQYDPFTGSVNLTLPTGEPISMPPGSILVPDLSIGSVWYATWDKGMGVYAGLSLHHVNRPAWRWFPTSASRLDVRAAIVAGAEWPLGGFTQFLPFFLYTCQGMHQRFNAGLPLRFNPKEWDDKALRLGIWLQANQQPTGQAWFAGEMAFQAMLEMGKWQVGLAYTLPGKSLPGNSFSRNAFELNLTWTQPPNYRKKIACPRM